MKFFLALLFSCVASGVTALAAVPTVTNPAAGTVTEGAVTLSAKVGTNGATTNVVFRYGFGGNLDKTATRSLSDSAVVQDVSVNLNFLVGGQAYAFKVEATNPDGTAETEIVNFFVPSYRPTITVRPVTTQPGGRATLAARITANGAVTNVAFDYGKVAGTYGTTVAPVPNPVPADGVDVDVFAEIDGLERGVVYHYKVTANGNGVRETEDQSFVATANQPPVTGADRVVLKNTDPILVSVLANDRDPEGDAISLVSVAGARNGTAEIVGNQIRYTPGGEAPTADIIIYTVRDNYAAAPGTSTGTLTINAPGLASKGVQAVALKDAEGNTIGMVKLTGSVGGAVTGKLDFYDQTYRIMGQLDEQGRFFYTVPREGGDGPIQLRVNFDQTDEGTNMKARLMADGHEFTGDAPLGVFSNARRLELSGLYTMQLPAPGGGTTGEAAALPGGTGYMRVLVSATGNVTFKGQLGDGTKFTGGSVLSGNDATPTISYWLTPDQNRVSGEIAFSADTKPRLTSAMNWYRSPDGDASFFPDGFYTEVAAVGGFYEPPADGRRAISPTEGSQNKAILTLTNGNLGATITHQYDISKGDRLTLLDPTGDGMTLKIDRSKGTFKGEFDHPMNGSRRKFQGVIVQQDSLGRGVFIGTTQTGTVEFKLGVVPPPVAPPTTPTTPTNPNIPIDPNDPNFPEIPGVDLNGIDLSGLNGARTRR